LKTCAAAPTKTHVLLEPMVATLPASLRPRYGHARRASERADARAAADHLIQDEPRFAVLANEAGKLASNGKIVLFGIRPTMPETGFGYIECDQCPAGDNAVAALRFVEKPIPRLPRILASGRYMWNSGMFCFTPATIIDALDRLAPRCSRRQPRRCRRPLNRRAIAPSWTRSRSDWRRTFRSITQ